MSFILKSEGSWSEIDGSVERKKIWSGHTSSGGQLRQILYSKTAEYSCGIGKNDDVRFFDAAELGVRESTGANFMYCG